MLGQFIPEGLLRDPSDPFDWAVPFTDVVRPLWHPLDPLQKERSRVLDSLVASAEMLPLEPDDRHPSPSPKLPTSTRPTSPAAPASAPRLPSSSIAPIPPF